MAGNSIRVGYSAWDMLNSAHGTAEPDTVQTNSTEYVELLNNIRTKISETHANTLNGILTNPNAYNILMPIILGYVMDYVNATNDLTINASRTADRIYQDMAGFGILTPYLNDPTVEEININAWNSIEVIWADREVLLEDTFSTPQECVDIIKKMVRIGGVHIDYSQPIIDSFIGDGTRISATLPPVNSDQVGATASIRKQTYKNVTREQYLQMGFATPVVFDFVSLCVMHGISLGIAGSPGAGKTTYTTCMLKHFIREKKTGNNRVVTIEEAREIDLTEVEDVNPGGGHARMTSRVLQWATTRGEKPITQRMLIKHTLRVNPAIMLIAEMRGEEAMEAVEAGQTGVQILSTFHAWGAKDGFLRVMSMCQMGQNSASENTIMSQVIQAFPIMVFIKKDDDGVRRIHEIFEATGTDDGRVVGNTLFRYIRKKVIEDENGKIVRIYGDFVQVGSISRKLRQRLIQQGAKKVSVDEYYFTDNRDTYADYDESNVEIEVIDSRAQVKENEVQPESIIPVWQTPVVTDESEEPCYFGPSTQDEEEIPGFAACDGITENSDVTDDNTEIPDQLFQNEQGAKDSDDHIEQGSSAAQAPTVSGNELVNTGAEEAVTAETTTQPKSFWGGVDTKRRRK